ncbi:MAG: hypothetical protein KC416_17680, partial [Myxococcales bacterium]|nr:hypothetical protein [Myxococcales bacterium]
MRNILSMFLLALLVAVFASAPAKAQEGSATFATNTQSSSSRPIQLALQARIDTLNLLGGGDLTGAQSVTPITPFATIGVRLLDQRLFLGAGVGLAGTNTDNGNGNGTGRSAFALSPVILFDVLRNDLAALSVGGWFNIGRVGDTSDDNGNANNDGYFGFGANAVAGIRAFLNPNLAIGGEFGWAFFDVNADANGGNFSHGLFGTLLFEAGLDI